MYISYVAVILFLDEKVLLTVMLILVVMKKDGCRGLTVLECG